MIYRQGCLFLCVFVGKLLLRRVTRLTACGPSPAVFMGYTRVACMYLLGGGPHGLEMPHV